MLTILSQPPYRQSEQRKDIYEEVAGIPLDARPVPIAFISVFIHRARAPLDGRLRQRHSTSSQDHRACVCCGATAPPKAEWRTLSVLTVLLCSVLEESIGTHPHITASHISSQAWLCWMLCSLRQSQKGLWCATRGVGEDARRARSPAGSQSQL